MPAKKEVTTEPKSSTKATTAKEKPFVLPKSLAACADLLYATKEQRLSKQRELDELQKRETALKDHLIEQLPKGEASGISGKFARVAIVTKDVPRVEDWDAFYKHVKSKGAFELLQKRLADGAVKERWEQGKAVPGVGSFKAVTVSITKV